MVVNKLSWVDFQTWASGVHQSNYFDERKAIVMLSHNLSHVISSQCGPWNLPWPLCQEKGRIWAASPRMSSRLTGKGEERTFVAEGTTWMDSTGGECLLLGGKVVVVSKLWLHAADLLKKYKKDQSPFWGELLVWIEKNGLLAHGN